MPLFFIFSNVIDNFLNYDFFHIIELTLNSLYVGFIASFLIVAIAFYILNVKRVAQNKFVNSVIKILTTGYAIPGAVIGLSLMLLLRLMGDNYTFLLGTILFLNLEVFTALATGFRVLFTGLTISYLSNSYLHIPFYKIFLLLDVPYLQIL